MPIKIIKNVPLQLIAKAKTPPSNKKETVSLASNKLCYPDSSDLNKKDNKYKGAIVLKPTMDWLEFGFSLDKKEAEEIEKGLNAYLKDGDDTKVLSTAEKYKNPKAKGYIVKSSEAQAAEEQERQARKKAFLGIKDAVILDVKAALAKEDYQRALSLAKPYTGLDVAELEELYSLATQQTQKKVEAEAQASRIKSKIHPQAVHEMVRQDGWEKTYATWGNEWMKKINQMQYQVAEKVAASPECDRVNIVGLDTENSIPKKKAVFFVDCENKKRFYVSNTDLESKTAVESLQAKNARISDSTAMIECRNAARRMVSHPSTFKPSVLDQSVYRAPSGNIVVTAGFKAKNSFGLELDMRARCVFDENGMSTPEIFEK